MNDGRIPGQSPVQRAADDEAAVRLCSIPVLLVPSTEDRPVAAGAAAITVEEAVTEVQWQRLVACDHAVGRQGKSACTVPLRGIGMRVEDRVDADDGGQPPVRWTVAVAALQRLVHDDVSYPKPRCEL